MIYNTPNPITPVWDFPVVQNSYSGDLGYRADTHNYSQEDDIGPTISFAQNGQVYETKDLTVSTLIRFDKPKPPINPYLSAEEGGFFLPFGNYAYNIIMEVDYEPSVIEFNLSIIENSVGQNTNYLTTIDLTGKLDYDIFYQLGLHIDSSGLFNILLTNYDTQEILINLKDFPTTFNLDNARVGILMGGVGTFNNFVLEGNAVQTTPEPTTVVLFGFGLLGLAGIRRKKKEGEGSDLKY
jgi:hypothetical protein